MCKNSDFCLVISNFWRSDGFYVVAFYFFFPLSQTEISSLSGARGVNCWSYGRVGETASWQSAETFWMSGWRFVLRVDGCPLWRRRRRLCDGLFSHEMSWRKWFFVVIIIIGVWTCSWVHHYSSVTRQASPSALKMQETINRPWDRSAVWQWGGIILFTSYLYISCTVQQSPQMQERLLHWFTYFTTFYIH